MNARDELATVIGTKLDGIFGTRDFGPATQDYKLADELIAAGYLKPRTITTAEELQEAHMVVVRTEAGTIANIVSGRAYCFGYEASAPVGSLSLPVTVLWEREPTE